MFDFRLGWSRCLPELGGETSSECIVSRGIHAFADLSGVLPWLVYRSMVSRWRKHLPFLPRRFQHQANSPSPEPAHTRPRILSYNQGIRLYG